MISGPFTRPLVALSLFLGVSLLLLSLQLRNRSGEVLLQGWLADLAAPLLSAASSAGSQGREIWEDLGSMAAAAQQSRRLQRENYELRLELQQLRQLDLLHSRLEDYRRFQADYRFTTIAAPVVGKTPPFLRHSILIGVGSRNGVRRDGAVITPAGAVGRVTQVSSLTSEVELITNAGAATGVLVGEEQVQGIAQGSGDDTVSIRYIPLPARVQVGDAVVTSGTDQIYPPGIPLGRVSRQEHAGEIYQEIEFRPAVNLAGLREVLVVSGYRYGR